MTATAILFDIENLLGGGNFSVHTASQLSLRGIVEEVRAVPGCGAVSVLRAYANWSDSRLGFMRTELVELGVDPIQVFGFSRDNKKNAADIQLAIDAVDLAHVRPGLSSFVIVSGDGGFGALARKLREYGKVVIGAAFPSATNRSFKAVCDHFIAIRKPEDLRVEEAPKVVSPVPGGHGLAAVQPLGLKAPRDEVERKCKEVLKVFAGRTELDMAGAGLALNVVADGFKAKAPGFAHTAFGFAKFSEFMQYICVGTGYCVARAGEHEVRLFTRRSRINRDQLPDLERRDLHNEEGYRGLLAHGTPSITVPAIDALNDVASALVELVPDRQLLGDLLDDLAEACEYVSAEEARTLALTLANVDVLTRHPENAPTSDATFTLAPEAKSAAIILRRLRDVAERKLRSQVGDLQDSVVDRILPRAL